MLVLERIGLFCKIIENLKVDYLFYVVYDRKGILNK